MGTVPLAPALDDRSVAYIQPQPPSDDTLLPAEERWIALVAAGLLDLEAVPVLERGPQQVCCGRWDDVEMYVVLGVESGATMRALIQGGPHAADDVVRAMARLAFRGLLRFA